MNESDKKKKKATSAPKDPNLVLLLKLYQTKMIEPYVLLNAADEGIAQDYSAHCEKTAKSWSNISASLWCRRPRRVSSP